MTIEIKDIDTATGEEIVRVATNDEITAMEIAAAEIEAMKLAETAKQAAKTAVLDKLGLTAEELAAVLS